MTTAPPDTTPQRTEQPGNDLGFGSIVAGATRRRFLNRDGTFNVRRVGLSLTESRSVYRYFLDVSWLRFFSHVGWWYLGTNLIFAVAYMALGPGSLEGPEDYGGGLAGHFLKAFFFSVQTLATIGYGRISPMGVAANLVVALESVCGLVLFALITGLAFSRFSRPRPRILFSEQAIIAPYGKITGFMFRIANARTNELFDVQAEVSFARRKPGGSVDERLFDSLKLERKSVTFFPLSWTVVHPIDQSSPLWHMNGESLEASEAEFLIRLTAFDETTGQTVHARSSYRWDEVTCGARFVRILDRTEGDGIIRVDVKRLSEIEPATVEQRA